MEPLAVVLVFLTSLGLAVGAALATLGTLFSVMHRGVMASARHEVRVTAGGA